jgi:hypothetical protein
MVNGLLSYRYQSVLKNLIPAVTGATGLQHLSWAPSEGVTFMHKAGTMVELVGLEPTTPCVQGKCSPS